MSILPLGLNGRVGFDENFGFVAEKRMTFDGGTANDPGDQSGSGNPATLFTITGSVRMKILAVCKTTLTSSGAPTLEVGITGDTAALIAQTTGTDIDVGEIWHDATPDSKIELTSVLSDNIVSNDVIQTVGTADVTAGEIHYYALWYPLSPDGNVVAA